MKTSTFLVFLLNATVVAADWWSSVNWWKMQLAQNDHDKLDAIATEVALLKADNFMLKANNTNFQAKIATLEEDNAQLKADMRLVFKTIGPLISPPSSPPPPPISPPPSWLVGTFGQSCTEVCTAEGMVCVTHRLQIGSINFSQVVDRVLPNTCSCIVQIVTNYPSENSAQESVPYYGGSGGNGACGPDSMHGCVYARSSAATQPTCSGKATSVRRFCPCV
mmetsp:Transcript_33209/g.97714  ORF Transcript_33209/g.97714 Transcript_33209/m.97714 type:complete len:221 (+) Transcript_33209:93-755(+)|eukprot:7387034-Prymnesium_polylepis.1